MTITAARDQYLKPARDVDGGLVVALPEPSLSMTQDAEWCVVRLEGRWRQIRFHDYKAIYRIPGLYEKVIYDILKCDSPYVIRQLLEAELAASGTAPAHLRVLDLGAGNGMMAGHLAEMGAGFIVGADIIEEAAVAAERDRPGLYDDYHVVDMTALNQGQRRELVAYGFNALTCVAALGFGDISPLAFATAYDLVAPGGWIAFNIKEDFLSDHDHSGFAGLIRVMLDAGILKLHQQRRYQHRLSTSGKPLYYKAMAGRKLSDIREDMIP